MWVVIGSEAQRHKGRITESNILISVDTEISENIIPRKEISKEAEAQEICTTGETSAKDSSATEHPLCPPTAAYSHTRP